MRKGMQLSRWAFRSAQQTSGRLRFEVIGHASENALRAPSVFCARRFFVRGRVVSHEDKFFSLIEDLNLPGIRDEMLKDVRAEEATGPSALASSGAEVLQASSDLFRSQKRDGLLAASAVLGVLDTSSLTQAQLDAVFDVLKHTEVIMKEIGALDGGASILNEDWEEDYRLLHQRFAQTGDRRILGK